MRAADKGRKRSGRNKTPRRCLALTPEQWAHIDGAAVFADCDWQELVRRKLFPSPAG